MDQPPPFSIPFCSSLFLWLLTIEFLVSVKIPSCSSEEDWYTKCSNNFTCGSLTATYPFWGASRPSGCGIPELQLTCQTDTTSIVIKNVKYRVLEIHPNTQILRIERDDFSNGICSPSFINTSLDPPLLDYVSGYSNITFVYGCLNLPINFPGVFNCDLSGTPYKTGYIEAGNSGIIPCYNSVYFPVSNATLSSILDMSAVEEGVKHGFEVKWNVDGPVCNECTGSNGVCGYDLNSNKTTCYCPDRYNWLNFCSRSGFTDDPASTSSEKDSNHLPLAIGLSIAGAAMVGLILGGWFMHRQKRKAISQTPSKEFLSPSPFHKIVHTPSNLSISIPSYPYSNSKSDIEKGSTYFGVQVFSFIELEEATDNFDPAKELGSGGFGTVYHGVLRDGRSVAVKRLFDNNMKRTEQFMNEVEILHRLRHPNLVTLHGCTSRRSKELILVYEYIPNGTVADHIHQGKSNSAVLTWPVRFNIAVETADALTYLHASDVIHRDVKTNNILLDNKFHVKVADFGLSRLFPNNCTHVSTAPQGTPGYVDPEYYHTYQLTDKSDVYSFGVVLIELISSLEAVDTSRDRHHINLASMAITKIQNQSIDELIDPSLGFEKDPMVRKMAKMVAEVAFRCLQQERDMRPTMGEVLQILRKIQSENSAVKAKELDSGQDDVGLLKHVHPPLSPDSVVNGKWFSSSTLSSY